jgi:polar amino acid transport system permease protein
VPDPRRIRVPKVQRTSQAPSSPAPGEDEERATSEDSVVVPVRHWGRWIYVAVLAVLAAMLVHTIVTNPRFQWGVVGQYFTDHAIVLGLYRTMLLTVVAMAIGIVLGTVLAVMRLSPNPAVSQTAAAYVWFFRGTPLLVQLIFWYNLAALYPRLSLGIPFGPAIFTGNANQFVTVYVAAYLGLGLNEAAYMSEIVRAGLSSVDHGQREAADALGMSSATVLGKIVLPQAMRFIIPPTGNQLIGMLKTTSLVSVIALPDLLYSAQLIYSQNFQTVPLLIVCCIWYLILTTILSIGQHFLERRFNRSAASVPTPWQRLALAPRRARTARS